MKRFIALNSLLIAIEMLINLYLKVLLARNVAKTELVIYYSFIDCIAFFVLFHSGFKDALIKSYNESGQAKTILNIFRRNFLSLLAITFFALPLAIPHFFATNESISGLDLVIIEFGYLANLCSIYLSYQMLAFRKYESAVWISFVRAIIFTVAMLALLFVFDQVDWRMLMICYGLSFLAATLIFSGSVRNVICGSDSPVDKKKYYRYAASSSLEYILSAFFIYGSTLLYLTYFSVESLADFQVVARPVYLALISIFSFPIFRFMFPTLSHLVELKSFDTIRSHRLTFLKITVLVCIVLNIGAFTLADFVIPKLFTAAYANSSDLVKLLVLVVPFEISQTISAAMLKASGKFNEVLLGRVAGTIGFVAAFYILMSLGVKETSVIYSLMTSVLVTFMYLSWKELGLLKSWRGATA